MFQQKYLAAYMVCLVMDVAHNNTTIHKVVQIIFGSNGFIYIRRGNTLTAFGAWSTIVNSGFVKYASTTNYGHVKVDGTTITVNNGVISAHTGVPTLTKQTATVPTTYAGLSVSHLYAESDGTIHEGVFDITNSKATDVIIQAEEVFATNLSLAAKAATYSAIVWGTGDPLTLEVNDTGKSINFTTTIEIRGNSTLHIYVRDNNG